MKILLKAILKVEERITELNELKLELNRSPITTYEELQHRLKLLDRTLTLRATSRNLQKLYEGRL